MSEPKAAEEPTSATGPEKVESQEQQMMSLLNAASVLTEDKAAAASSSAPKAAKASDGDDDMPMTFPQKLMELVSNEDHADIVSWLPHGKGFIVYKKKKFTTEVMPKYFKNSKYTSFTRKLNRWGFSRITRGPETGAYYHQFFQRGNIRLCMQMSCQSVKNGKSNDPMVQQNMMMQPMVFPGNPMPKGMMFPPGDISQQNIIRQQLQQLQLQQLQLQQMQMQQHQQQLQAAELFRKAMSNKADESKTDESKTAESTNAESTADKSESKLDANVYLQNLQRGLLPALEAGTALARQQQSTVSQTNAITAPPPEESSTDAAAAAAPDVASAPPDTTGTLG